jgi:membrane dipeptidase
VAAYSEKPFVASHSCARALCGHSRNLTDAQLERVADSGGVAGVNFNAKFLKDDAAYTAVRDIAEHISHMISVMGSDHVALGSDFDGMDCRLEIADYSQYGKLISALEKKYSDDVIEKICYQNVLRVIKDCL